MRTYRHTDIRTGRHTDRQRYRQADIQTYRHTDHTDIQTYRQTDITYIHIYIYTYMHTCRGMRHRSLDMTSNRDCSTRQRKIRLFVQLTQLTHIPEGHWRHTPHLAWKNIPMMAIIASLPLASSALSFLVFSAGSEEVNTLNPKSPAAAGVPADWSWETSQKAM